MAKYKDPEERLEDIEHMVRDIKHTVNSMQRRAVIMTIFRLLKLAAMTAILLWVYHGLQPFIENIGTASVQVEDNIKSVNNSIDSVKSFFGIQEVTE